MNIDHYRFTLSAVVLLALSVLGSCKETAVPTPSTAPTSEHKTQNDHETAAKFGDRLITLADVDAAVRFQLYDLKEAIYQLRLASLQKLLDDAADSQREPADPAVYLAPPKRPRIAIAKDSRPRRGAAAAPLTLSVFCSYQSSHCVRLQPTLITLLREYEGLINVVYYDFPQNFHKHDGLLAEAVRCAADQQAMWQFQDHILARVDKIDRAGLLNIAGQLLLDAGELDKCLTLGRYREEVEKDRILANQLGIRGVPVSFINGIYLRGPQSADVFRDIIDRELIALGVTPRKPLNRTLGLSPLPIKLMASSVNSDPKRSKALLEIAGESPDFFHIGDKLMPQVALHMIGYDAIVIDNRGQFEMVKLWVAGGDINISRSDDTSLYSAAGQTAAPPDKATDSAAEEYAEEPGNPSTLIPEPTAILPLSRAWVDTKLMEQIELERQIEKGEHVVEGHNLMKLSQNDLDEFYQLLGMEPGDVLMMVNEQWVHSGNNPLWEALRTEDSVTAVVMRRGLPVVYKYDIQAGEE